METLSGSKHFFHSPPLYFKSSKFLRKVKQLFKYERDLAAALGALD